MQNRNTDRDWNELAKRDPYYAVLSHPRYSHAENNPAMLKELFESGEHWIDAAVAEIKLRLRADFAPRVGVDFGCGVARLLIPMSRYCSEVVGVDVSEPMRALARKNLEQRAVRSFRIFESADALADAGVQSDWINSYIVFQHIPPPAAMSILDILLGCLRDGGVVSLHLTFAKDRRMLEWSTRHVEHYQTGADTFHVLTERAAPAEAVQSMYDHDMNHVLIQFVRHGIRRVWMTHEDHGGQHGMLLYGVKGEGAAPGR